MCCEPFAFIFNGSCLLAATHCNMVCDMKRLKIEACKKCLDPVAMDRNAPYNQEMGLNSEYSLAEVIAVAHADVRLAQFWIESGALRPTADTHRQGRGRHRRFDYDEAVLACILTELSRGRMPVGQLIRFAHGFREQILKRPKGRNRIKAAIAGSANVYIVILDPMCFYVELLEDPGPEQAMKLFTEMAAANRRGAASRTVLYLNPLFEELRE
jgi:hypothetical protein